MANNTIMTAKNTFSEGLVMDFAPDNTLANCLTSALNATLLTFNGNEMSLQNDMGNARVETARLPEGYIPVGSCEFGGIIYIVSYNPINNKSQIGCFPSPERNFTSDELGQTDVKLSAGEFQELIKDENTELKPTGKLKTSSIKKVLYMNNLNPGDKYIISSGEISGNSECLSDYGNTSHNLEEINRFPKFLQLHVVSIEESGKINYLDTDVKWYNDYFICDKTVDGIQQKPDLDSYRSLVSSEYSIFQSKVSGKLCILAELERITDFDAAYELQMIQSENYYNDIKTAYETAVTSIKNIKRSVPDNYKINAITQVINNLEKNIKLICNIEELPEHINEETKELQQVFKQQSLDSKNFICEKTNNNFISIYEMDDYGDDNNAKWDTINNFITNYVNNRNSNNVKNKYKLNFYVSWKNKNYNVNPEYVLLTNIELNGDKESFKPDYTKGVDLNGDDNKNTRYCDKINLQYSISNSNNLDYNDFNELYNDFNELYNYYKTINHTIDITSDFDIDNASSEVLKLLKPNEINTLAISQGSVSESVSGDTNLSRFPSNSIKPNLNISLQTFLNKYTTNYLRKNVATLVGYIPSINNLKTIQNITEAYNPETNELQTEDGKTLYWINPVTYKSKTKNQEAGYYSLYINNEYYARSPKKTLTDDFVNNYLNRPVKKHLCTVGIPNLETDNPPTEYLLKYTIAPAMPYGILDDLAIDGVIDFTKINSGKCEMHTWKYLNDTSTCKLVYGQNCYPFNNHKITKIVFEFYDNMGLVARKIVNNKESYSGTFTTTINLGSYAYNDLITQDENDDIIKHPGGEPMRFNIYINGKSEQELALLELLKKGYYVACKLENDKLVPQKLEDYTENGGLKDLRNDYYIFINDAGYLQPNWLYYVKIKYYQQFVDNNGITIGEEKYKFDDINIVNEEARWLWTNSILNEKFYTVDDFKEINEITFDVDLDSEFKSNDNFIYTDGTNNSENIHIPDNLIYKHENDISTNDVIKNAKGYQERKIEAKDNKANVDFRAAPKLVNNYGAFILNYNFYNKYNLNVTLPSSDLEGNINPYLDISEKELAKIIYSDEDFGDNQTFRDLEYSNVSSKQLESHFDFLFKDGNTLKDNIQLSVNPNYSDSYKAGIVFKGSDYSIISCYNNKAADDYYTTYKPLAYCDLIDKNESDLNKYNIKITNLDTNEVLYHNLHFIFQEMPVIWTNSYEGILLSLVFNSEDLINLLGIEENYKDCNKSASFNTYMKDLINCPFSACLFTSVNFFGQNGNLTFRKYVWRFLKDKSTYSYNTHYYNMKDRSNWITDRSLIDPQGTGLNSDFQFDDKTTSDPGFMFFVGKDSNGNYQIFNFGMTCGHKRVYPSEPNNTICELTLIGEGNGKSEDTLAMHFASLLASLYYKSEEKEQIPENYDYCYNVMKYSDHNNYFNAELQCSFNEKNQNISDQDCVFIGGCITLNDFKTLLISNSNENITENELDTLSISLNVDESKIIKFKYTLPYDVSQIIKYYGSEKDICIIKPNHVHTKVKVSAIPPFSENLVFRNYDEDKDGFINPKNYNGKIRLLITPYRKEGVFDYRNRNIAIISKNLKNNLILDRDNILTFASSYSLYNSNIYSVSNNNGKESGKIKFNTKLTFYNTVYSNNTSTINEYGIDHEYVDHFIKYNDSNADKLIYSKVYTPNIDGHDIE